MSELREARGLRVYVDRRFEELEEYVDSRVAGLGRAFSSYQEFLVEHLAVRGVTSESGVALLKSEARRLVQAATLNPFTREEWEGLKRYLDEDTRDFTL